MKYKIKLLLLALSLFACESVMSQIIYYPSSNANWVLHQFDDFGAPLGDYDIDFQGPIQVAGQTYYQYRSVPSPCGWVATRVDSLNRVYRICQTDTNEVLLYDFSVETGDTIPDITIGLNGPYSINNDTLICDTAYSISLPGGNRKGIFLHSIKAPNFLQEIHWIEGIGAVNSHFLFPTTTLVSGYYDVSCHTNYTTNSGYGMQPCFVGLDAGAAPPRVTLNPNPCNTSLKLETDLKQAPYEVVDIHGRSCAIGTWENQAIDVSQLMDGIYYLRVHAGNEVISKPFVKRAE